jgi:hypothetical protein
MWTILRKKVSSMGVTYDKPEIVLFGDALPIIEYTNMKLGGTISETPFILINPAYDLDE